jgi:hypothetical protein
MYAFDAQLQPQGVQVTTDQEDGATQTQVCIAIGGFLPINNPPLPVPLGILRFPFNKKNLGDLIQALQQAHDTMKDDSSLVTAQSVDEAERVAAFHDTIRGS